MQFFIIYLHTYPSSGSRVLVPTSLSYKKCTDSKITAGDWIVMLAVFIQKKKNVVIRAIWGSSKSAVEVFSGALSLALMEGWLKQPTMIRKCARSRVRICDMIDECLCAQSLSCSDSFMTSWTIAHQAPLSIGFSRQEYWSGLSFPPPGDFPDPGIEPTSPASSTLRGRFFIALPTILQ